MVYVFCTLAHSKGRYVADATSLWSSGIILIRTRISIRNFTVSSPTRFVL